MEYVAWLRAALGGALIGASAALLWRANGRIAGVAGIAGRALLPALPRGERRWRGCFLLGMLVGGGALRLFAPGVFGAQLARANPLQLAAAGLLVGVGTGLANGCTSGHGVCGLSRRSPRSLAAVLTFMLVAAATVYGARPLQDPAGASRAAVLLGATR